MFDPASVGVGLEQDLNPFKGRPVEDGLLFALEPLAAVMNLADVDAVFQEIGEGTVREGDATIVLGDLGVPTLGDDATPIQFGDKFAE